jgi:hypothetical protein
VTRVAAAAAAIGALSAFVAGCAHEAAAVRKPDAQLAVHVNVPDARIYVDETFAGRAADLERGVPVVSGKKRVEVRADGWFAAYRDVAVTPGARATLDVALRRVPDGEPGD